jgi:hypothetical protein
LSLKFDRVERNVPIDVSRDLGSLGNRDVKLAASVTVPRMLELAKQNTWEWKRNYKKYREE